MMSKLDTKDKKILSEIDLNGRFFVSEVAKKVGLSKDVVNYRLAQLEKRGVIRGYHALVNLSKLGLIQFTVSINLMDIKPNNIKEMIDFLKSKHNIIKVVELDVVWDLTFDVVVKNHKEFENLYTEFKDKFKRFIEVSNIAIITDQRILARNYFLPSKEDSIEKAASNEIQIKSDDKESWDEVDLKIIKRLAINARTSLLDLAKELKLDSMTVKRRIQNLQKKDIIAGFRTDLNVKNLSITPFFLRFVFYDTKDNKKLEGFVRNLPEAVLITKGISSYDFSFDVEVQDYFALEKILINLRERFFVVREINHYSILRTHKNAYLEDIEKILG